MEKWGWKWLGFGAEKGLVWLWGGKRNGGGGYGGVGLEGKVGRGGGWVTVWVNGWRRGYGVVKGDGGRGTVWDWEVKGNGEVLGKFSEGLRDWERLEGGEWLGSRLGLREREWFGFGVTVLVAWWKGSMGVVAGKGGKYTPQYQWLEAELPKVNRTQTPWLIVLVHSPWYNSYNYHYMEGETMRVMFEPWFVQYKVDVVFAGHVHAYERSERVSNIAYNIVNGRCEPVKDLSAPVYITIGDGGNIEGLANNMTQPQPAYSAYREASFGHATFEIKNRTHAYYSWHRNQDQYSVEADSMWFSNRYWNPIDDSTPSH
ncbi:purple acid phosphatase 2-like [Senna tora]|uniref:acid phosphatase n=1 Tax=Senna tora TaxID=362788 RepID=A0A834WMX8_9FABA|nr:purple acid phosphatase 2-like [Senna tora]